MALAVGGKDPQVGDVRCWALGNTGLDTGVPSLPPIDLKLHTFCGEQDCTFGDVDLGVYPAVQCSQEGSLTPSHRLAGWCSYPLQIFQLLLPVTGRDGRLQLLIIMCCLAP